MQIHAIRHQVCTYVSIENLILIFDNIITEEKKLMKQKIKKKQEKEMNRRI